MNQSTAAYPVINSPSKAPALTLIKDGQRPVHYNKDGSVDGRSVNRNRKPVGKSSEVFAFTSFDQINAMNAILDDRIENSVGLEHKMACRNKLLFNVGINVGLRASDLRVLKWSFFFEDETLMVKDHESIMPKKQRKQHKFVKIFCNDNVVKALNQYMEQYPVENLDDYLFFSRKGNEPMTEWTMWDIIKKTAIQAGIKQNIGTHSLRKTFGYWAYHLAADKSEALVRLQQIFRHDNPITTMRYIGIYDNELKSVFDSLNFGEDYLQ